MKGRSQIQTNKKDSVCTEVLAVFFMFVVSVVIRTAIAYRYPVHLDTYPDELRYYRMATSFANGTGLSLYNSSYDFQKILYALCIAPACLLQSVNIRLATIFFLNSLMISAGVFPIYYLSRILLRNRAYRMGICAIYLISGHMTYTMTFMSENLWFPLVLLLLCVFCSLFKQQENVSFKKILWLNFCAGIFSYIAYLCKEIALIFPLAYMAYFITWEFYVSRRNIQQKIKKDFLQFTVYGIGFAVPFIALKLTLFHAMRNSYNQQGLDALAGNDKIYYLLYGTGYYVLNVLTMSFLFPVLLPCMNFDKMKAVGKKLYIFLVWLVLTASFVVSYTISIREDYPLVNPRAHMRYIAWVMPMFILILGHLLETDKLNSNKRSRIIQASTILSIGSIHTIFYRGPNMSSHVDATMYIYYGKTANQILLLNVMLVIISAVITMIFYNRRMTVALCLALILGTQIYDNVWAEGFQNENYKVSESLHSEAIELKEFVQSNPQSNFLVVDFFLSSEQRTLDTYLTEKNVYVTSCQRLTDTGHDLGNICLGSIEIPVIWHEVGFYNVMDIDYIIVRNICQIVESDNCLKLLEMEGEKYSIYKILDSTESISIILSSDGG